MQHASRLPSAAAGRPSSVNRAPYAFSGGGEAISHEELKLQLSFQTKAADNLFGGNGDLWLAYTQVSYWQAFNEGASAPFRESNYEPEAFVSFLTDYRVLGLRLRAASAGIMHQSNGRSQPLSRSWNRLYGELQLVRGAFGLSVKPWVRIERGGSDDNPDIEDYLGRYELRASYERGGHVFGLMLRNVFDRERRYNSELSWSFPITGRLRGLVQWYNGYGENLIDYNHSNHRFGVGILMSDWP
jgi:phospholipase A1/A2